MFLRSIGLFLGYIFCSEFWNILDIATYSPLSRLDPDQPDHRQSWEEECRRRRANQSKRMCNSSFYLPQIAGPASFVNCNNKQREHIQYTAWTSPAQITYDWAEPLGGITTFASLFNTIYVKLIALFIDHFRTLDGSTWLRQMGWAYEEVSADRETHIANRYKPTKITVMATLDLFKGLFSYQFMFFFIPGTLL